MTLCPAVRPRRNCRPARAMLCGFLAVLLSLGALLPVAAQPSSGISLPRLDVSVSAQSAILIDADSGAVLYAKDAETRLPMASTTKIMTALCAVELADLSTSIAVDAKAVGVEGSSVYLQAGEILTLEQLLYALLLQSANDAAAAIAIGTAGSVEAFAARMNRKAAELGLENSNFENPHGLDSAAHYTTAHDLALIARALLAHPALRKIVSTRKITIPLNGDEGTRVLVNHNKLLRTYPGAIGVKTGYTMRSGRCLVSAAERDGLTLIAVTLHAPDDWSDHTRLLDAGFAAYERVTLCDKDGYSYPLPLVGGTEDYVMVRNQKAVAITLPRARGATVVSVELPSFLWAPVEASAQVGQLVYHVDTNGDGRLDTDISVPLTTAYALSTRPKVTLLGKIRAWLKSLFSFKS